MNPPTGELMEARVKWADPSKGRERGWILKVFCLGEDGGWYKTFLVTEGEEIHELGRSRVPRLVEKAMYECIRTWLAEKRKKTFSYSIAD